MPIALPAQACKNCVIPWCAEFDQFTDATAHPAPPFPVTHAGANPPTTNGHTVVLLPRVNPSQILLMSILPHGKPISPDKDVNFPCTTAAFTLPPEPVGFVVLCPLARRLSLICGFCSSPRTYALRLPSDGESPSRPCLRLVLLVVSIYDEYLLVLVQGTFTP